MGKINNLQKLESIRISLKERGIETRAKQIALRHSNGRTDNMKRLTPEEVDFVLAALREFTDDKLLQAIYDAAFGLKIIPSQLRSLDNDELIIAFLKKQGIMNYYTNEVAAVNPVCIVIISAPFSNLKFNVKELLLSVLCDGIIQFMGKNN